MATGSALQRQRDQVAEPVFGQQILIREQPVVAREIQVRPAHRLAQEQSAKLPRGTRQDCLGEEDPDVGTVPGATSFDRGCDS